MPKLRIVGGRPIGGIFHPTGNKNAVLPMMAAALLTDQPVVLENVPDIADVRVMAELLSALGVSVRKQRGRRLSIKAETVRSTRLPAKLCAQIRACILLVGPLLARCGAAALCAPGGDLIGRRRLDSHLKALAALGAKATTGERLEFTARRLRAGEVLLDQPSVTATENVMMAAAALPGRTVIRNAACEPHVLDLAALLGQMGAQVRGVGTNTIQIEGAGSLGPARARVRPDHIEIGSLMAIAAGTGGLLEVPNVLEEDLWMIRKVLATLGVASRIRGSTLEVPGNQTLRIRNDLGEVVPIIEDGPWPQFPSDMMSAAVVLATQSAGIALFFEKMFESRMFFVNRLAGMGARLVLCDPHRVLVIGPSRLRGTTMSSPDIRAGMALVAAALCAHGESLIENAQVIDRGHEHIDRRLRQLGADIERLNP